MHAKSGLAQTLTYTAPITTTAPVKSILVNANAMAPPLIAVTPSLSMEEDDHKVPYTAISHRRASRPNSPPSRRQDILRRRSVEPLVHIYSNVYVIPVLFRHLLLLVWF